MPGKERISLVTAAFIVALTLTIDGLQILLTITVVGSIASLVLGLIMGFVLWLIFILHGVKYSGVGALKKVGASFGSMIVEMIPFIDALPITTVGAVIVILQTRKEDKEAREKALEEAQKAKQAQAARMQEQVRLQAANDNQMHATLLQSEAA